MRGRRAEKSYNLLQHKEILTDFYGIRNRLLCHTNPDFCGIWTIFFGAGGGLLYIYIYIDRYVLDIFEAPVTVTPQQDSSKTLILPKFLKLPKQCLTFTFLREAKPRGFQTGGFPTFVGKGPDCVADPFGTVPRRCS